VARIAPWMVDQRKRDKARAVADKACTRYGVFVWEGNGRYPADKVIGGKLYKSDKLAAKSPAANEQGGRDRVIRTVDVCTSDQKKAIFEKLVYGEPDPNVFGRRR
jgi:hypothetical protein